MGRANIFQTLLLAAVLCGCSNHDLDEVYTDEGNNSGVISFSTSADWTRGTEIFDNSGIGSLEVYSYFSNENYASWTSTTVSQYFTADIFTPFTLSVDDEGNGTYTGTQYWPSSGMLSFVAFAPNSTSGRNTLSCAADTEGDEATGLPKFTYTMLEQATDNDDLVFDALYDLMNDSNGSEVAFDLEHILTKLTLEAATTGTVIDDDKLGYRYPETTTGGVSTYIEVFSDEYYFVNGISFSGLSNNATLDFDFETGAVSWTIDGETTTEVIATHSNTLLPIYNVSALLDTTINSSAILKDVDTDGFMSVMNIDDESSEAAAIFMLPQLLGDCTYFSGTAPTAKVRIRRLFYQKDDLEQDIDGNVIIYYSYFNTDNMEDVYDCIYDSSSPGNLLQDLKYYFKPKADAYPSGEVLYSTEAIQIPSAFDSNGWEVGEWNNLQFTFDISKLSEYDTPLTLFSQIYAWTETTVDAEVHANTYIYTSSGDIELTFADETADMYVYTNYDYDLRRHKRNIELDGSATEAAGFTFYDFEDNCAEPVLLWTVDGVPNTVLYYVYDSSNNLYLSTENASYEEAEEHGATLYPITQTNGIADLSDYETTTYEDLDGDGDNETLNWISFRIYYPTDEDKYFDYKAAKLTRDDLGLYTNSTINGDSSYGVNKNGADAVYILRLDVNNDHLMNETGTDAAEGDYGYFSGKIGAELLSNGGGVATYKFSVLLKKALN
ncbi:MAG: fimbrillin family protein [Rikenellaceae bacterium]